MNNDLLNTYLKITCWDCKNVLSVYPITTDSSRYACGRHMQHRLLNGCAEIENVLATHHFACIHEGCTQKLMPVHMKPHEKSCSYRRFNCKIPNCKTSCLDIEFLTHFRNNHMDLMNNSGIVKRTDIENRPYQLVNYFDTLFLILSARSFEQRELKKYRNLNCTFNLRLFCLGSKSSEKYVFNVEHKNGRLCNKLVEPYDEAEVPIKMPKMENDDLLYIFVTRNHTKSSLMNPMRSISKTINCQVCKNPMSNPIYQCKNGHVICNHCTTDTINCPTCNSECNTIRNVVIDEMTEDVNNCFCEETQCSQLLDTEHTLECPFAAYSCPLCDINLKYYVTLYDHIKSKHNVDDYSFISMQSDLEQNETKESFLFRDYYLFKIVTEVVNSTLKLSVHLVGPRGNQNEFVWRMVNDSRRVEWLSFRRLCAKGRDTAVAFNSPNTFITLSRDMMLPVVAHNKFSYSIQIGPL